MVWHKKADTILIVPVYNVERCLEECLSSILSQTVLPSVVLLIDDGSTDRSGEICEKYSTDNDFIHVFHKKNEGVSSARNYGLLLNESKYHCQYILFLDSDDRIERNFVETMTRCCDETHSDIAVCGYKKIVHDHNDVKRTIKFCLKKNTESLEITQDLIFLFKNTALFMCFNKVFRGDIIKDFHIRFLDVHRFEDTYFVYQYMCHCNNISFVDQCLYQYNCFPNKSNTLTTRFFKEYCKGQFLVYKTGQKLLTHLKCLNQSSAVLKQFEGCLAIQLESGILGEIANKIPESKMKWHEREKYIKLILKRYKHTNAEKHLYEKSYDIPSKIIKVLYSRNMVTAIVLFTYIMHFVHFVKGRY